MKKSFVVLVFLCSWVVAHAQNVAVVNNKGISAKEFLWVIKKSNPGVSGFSYEDLYANLQRLIDFKLKAIDARSQKMDRDTSYLNEVKRYEKLIRERSRSRLGKEEYGFIIDEYRDGVLVFNISERKVWSKESDSGGAESLEEDWIKELRRKYSVRVDEEVLKKLVKI